MTGHDIFTALASLLLPPGSFFLLLLVVALPAWLYRKSLGATMTGILLLLLWVMCTPALADYLMDLHLRSLPVIQPLNVSSQLAGADAIVVLGVGGIYQGMEYGKPSLNADSYERLKYAVALAKVTGLPILYAGGGSSGESTGQTEALVAQVTALQEMQYELRWTENAGITVRESAKSAAQMLLAERASKIVLIAHAWKLPRAIAEFKAAGLEVRAAPMGFPDKVHLGIAAFFPTSEGVRWVRNVVRERFGIWRMALANHGGAN
ncbi:MAG: hypothetical protein JWQ72_1708 [Polaromonas sp.]|nr:hypothetical protein [Polaromonas sp.]